MQPEAQAVEPIEPAGEDILPRQPTLTLQSRPLVDGVAATVMLDGSAVAVVFECLDHEQAERLFRYLDEETAQGRLRVG